MKKTMMSVFACACVIAFAGNAMADQTAPTPVKQEEPKPQRGYGKLRLGFDLMFGAAPDPVNLDLTVNPFEDMLVPRVGISYNAITPGLVLGLRLDPLAYFSRLPIGLIGDLSGGWFSQGSPPSVSNGMKVGYNYYSLMGGLRLGRPTGFHWDFLVGSSWTNLSTSGFAAQLTSLPPGVTVGDPSGKLQVTPTFLTGFGVNWTL